LLIVLIELFHFPLVRQNGEVMALPVIYRVGFALSLLVGIVFLAGYIGRIAEESLRMSQALAATQLALSREHQLSSLGAMAAAAAHELGTPLATIAVTAREIERSLPEGADKEGDLELIRSQTARCRDILAELAGIQRQDMVHFHKAPLLSVLEEAAAPHLHSGKRVIFNVEGHDVGDIAPQTPEIERRPEVIHGMRNLIQNAVDFAYTTVNIRTRVGRGRIEVRIEDDGPGYPAELLGSLGEPFVSTRNRSKSSETSYQGMGLGIFIAKTLLERRGVDVAFFNRRKRADKPGGATAQLLWLDEG
jgi:two-component system sensor histidine kinase RegB